MYFKDYFPSYSTATVFHLQLILLVCQEEATEMTPGVHFGLSVVDVRFKMTQGLYFTVGKGKITTTETVLSVP